MLLSPEKASWLEITKEQIICFLPMPPQSNNMYGGAWSGRRFPSKELTGFKGAIEILRMQLRLTAHEKAILNTFVGTPIKLERQFHFHKASVFTKAGTIKRMDVSNRIKACDDALGVLFGIDDCFVFFGSEEKCVSKTKDDFVRLKLQHFG